MIKKLFFSFCIAAMSVLAVSCGNDDDLSISDIAGTYNCTVSFAGATQNNVSITITQGTKDGVVSMSLSNFTYMNTPLSLSINNVSATKANGKYALSYSDYISFTLGQTVSLPATLTGTVADKTLNASITVDASMLQLGSLIVTVAGTKK